MAFPSLEKALTAVSNRYLLVVLAAKRARQINRGSPARVPYRLPWTTAHSANSPRSRSCSNSASVTK